MAFGGGTYTKYDKFMPGTYINTITVGTPQPAATKGTVAAGLKLDWGPDNEIFEITATQFQENAEDITGYPYSDDTNVALRELFRHANRVVAYKLNSAGSAKASNDEVGEAKYAGKAGNNITVSCYRNVNDENKFDVTTYFNGEEKDKQTVEKDGIDEIKVTKGTEKPGTTVETADATFTVENTRVTIKFSNLPEGYKTSVRVKNSDGATVAFMADRLVHTESSDSLTHTIDFSPKFVKGQFNIEACVRKGATITVIKTCSITTAINEDVQTGASAAKLEDNNFVTFKAEGIITEGAGHVFSGGRTSPSVTASGYSNFLGALESRSFDTLVYDGDDKQVKMLVEAYTKRMRDERGKYFQSVLYNYPEADYEGIISIYNQASSDNPNVSKSSLTLWYAGYSSAVDLSNELTSKRYDGELTIDTSTPDTELEAIVKQGNVVFHKVSETEVYTLFDVNTLTSFTAEKDSQMSENKVVRIVDYLHNAESYYLNRNDVGRTPNTMEGRALIWNECYELLSELQSSGAITNFSPDNLTVDPVESDKHAVTINQTFTVAGTIYRIYITTYVVQ